MAKEAKGARIKTSNIKVKVVPKKRSLFSTFLILIGLAIIFYSLTAATPVSYTAEELVSQGEAYIVQVPYTREVAYQERVPYGRQVCTETTFEVEDSFVMDYKVMETPDGRNLWHLVCTVTVTNKEDIAGNFTYSAKFKKSKVAGGIDSPQQKKEIPGKGSVEFVFAMPMDNYGDLSSCYPNRVELQTGTLCKYVEPITYTYATRYRNVTEYRNETRYKGKTVEKTAVKYVNRAFGYTQFFYLGY